MAAISSMGIYALSSGPGKEFGGTIRSSMTGNTPRAVAVLPIIKSKSSPAFAAELQADKAYSEPERPLKKCMSKGSHLPKMGSVIGHRGTGSNKGPSSLESIEGYFAGNIRENTILAFNSAAALGADFVELDVQVTRDGVPIIWHDDYIYYKQIGSEEILSHQIKELSLAEFKQISYLGTICPQKPLVLMRKFKKKSPEFRPWVCRQEDELPTFEEVLRELPAGLGLNVELKFEAGEISNEDLVSRVRCVLASLAKFNHVERRLVISSFHPSACIEVRKMQDQYPVMMLTDAGYFIYDDERRNSFDAAFAIAKNHKMAGVVMYSNVTPTQEMVQLVQREGMKLLSYGEKNNEDTFSVEQIEMGVHAIVVDDVGGIRTSFAKKNLIMSN